MTTVIKKQATIFDFEQTNLFDFLDELEKQEVIICSNVTAQPTFTLKPGTMIYLTRHIRDKYEVVSDDGVNTVCRRYYDWNKETAKEETVVESKSVYAIAEPDLIPLPRIHRNGNLNLEDYKSKQQQFLNSLTDEMKMDMITFVLGFSSHTDYADQFLRSVHEKKEEWAAQLLHFGKEYIIPVGYAGTFRVREHYNSPFYISIGKDSQEEESYEGSVIVEHFLNMLERVGTKSIEEMSVFELILHYRQNGLKLMYAIETDEWWVSHPYSFRQMPVEGGRDQLNELQQVYDLYEEYSVLEKKQKRTNKQATLDVFDLLDDEEEVLPVEEVTGFKLPAGTRVQAGYDEYYVIQEDDGETALVIKTNRLGKPLEDQTEAIEMPSNSFRGAYIKKHFYVSLPRFHRPSDLTLEEIYERGIRHYNELTDKEATDYAVLSWTGTSGSSTDGRQFLRAYHENNIKYLEELLKGRYSGMHSRCVSLERDGSKFTLKIKTTNAKEITLSVSQAIKHFEQMMHNIKTKPSKALSLYELQLAYSLKGYRLEYCTESQEYRIGHIHGVVKVPILKGRYTANSVDETIQKFEKLIDAKQ